jgi:hypothetical protein
MATRSTALVVLALLATVFLSACGGAPSQGDTQQVTPTPSPTNYPRTGHAPDYSWVAGQVNFTRIQGGCVFVRTDTESFSPNGEGWQDDQVQNGDYVVIFGHPTKEGEPRAVCPGGQPYTVEKLMLNPQGGS